MAGGGDEWEEIGPEEAEPEEGEEEAPEPEEIAPPGEEEGPPEPAPEAAAAGDRSKFAMASGLGFFVLALLVYFLVVLPGDPALVALAAAAMGLTAATVYFWMAHDLRIRPKTLTRHMARFIAGLILGLLAIVGLATLVVFLGPAAAPGGWGKAATVFLLEFLTAADVSLLFYSMSWEG